MAYSPTDWKNRVYDDEGNIIQEGTPLVAENMNKIENQLVHLSEYPIKIEVNEQKLSEHEQKLSSQSERITEVENEIDSMEQSKGQPNGIATLGADGIIPSSQLPNNLKEIRVAASISERDAFEKFEGLRVLVTDASDDSTVGSGWAEYVWNGTEFIKTAEAEGVDFVVKWGNVTEKPSSFPPTKHEHTESEITDLDKYTKQEVNDLLAQKSDEDHEHTESDITNLDKYTKQEVNDLLEPKADRIELHSHVNKTTLDKLTEGHLTQIANHEERIETLEESSGQLHQHANKSTLDKLTYSGTRESIDLIEIEEQASRKYKYSEILETPTIPSKISDLTDDSEFVTSNAGRIFVQSAQPSNMQVNDIWIQVL